MKVNSEIDKVPCLRAKSLLAAMQPNLISALGQSISKGEINDILSFTGQWGAFRPGKEKGDGQI